jgi:hypothetical protein
MYAVMDMTDGHKLLLGFLLTLAGSGLGTTIVATILSNRFSKQLELLKSSLQRGSRIHERQMDALLLIHWRLERASYYLQRATSGALFGNETQEGFLKNIQIDLAAASDEYAQKKLLFSPNLVTRLDEFFKKVQSILQTVSFASDPQMPDGEPRAKLWIQAQEAAYADLPSVLNAISTEARDVIHLGESVYPEKKGRPG